MADQELTEQPKAFTVPPAPELAAVKGQIGGLPGVPDYAETRRRLKTSSQASEEAARQLQKRNQLDQEIGVAQIAKEQYLADAKADIARQEREAAQKIERGLDETRAKFPYPEFHPTKDNVETLTGLFSIIGLIGMAMGGAGKQSATLALNSMGGMMKGWQQGRSDLFKKEKEEFDKNMQRVKAVLDDAYRDADRAYKTLAYNRQEAEALAAQSAAKLGGQVGRQILERQGVNSFFEYVDGIKKDLQHTEDLAMRAAEKHQRITQQQMMSQRAVNSLGGVASALEAIKELPAGTTTGLLPNLQTKDGMMNYVRNTIGRKVTKREAEEMNTLFTGIGRNLASIEASGAATGLSELSKQMQSGLYINSGIDDPYKVAIKLADIRRIAVENILPAIQSGALTPGQAQAAQGLVDRIDRAIPFTTIDVIRAARPEGKPTIGEVTTGAVSGKKYATEQEAQSAFDRGELKVGDKVNVGGVSGTWR